MDESASATAAKLEIDDEQAEAIQRLGRWMRVVGTIQLAIAGMGLLFLTVQMACGAVVLGVGVAILFGAVLPTAIVAVFLLQALRIQAAGEQFKNLADERDLDYLELAFVRLKTVYIIDVAVAVLVGLVVFGGSL
jgi:hypothetical protein